MKRIFENILTFIIMTLIVLVIAVVIYIGLDIGGIIEVPDRVSLVKILNLDKKIVQATNTINEYKERKKSEKVFVNTNAEAVSDGVDYINKVYEGFDSLDNSKVENVAPNVVAHNKFYYSQLDSYGKKIYDKLESNTENMKDGLFKVDYKYDFDDLLHTENGSTVLDNAYKHGVCAYFLENPDLFYLNINKLCIITKKTILPIFTSYQVSIGAEEGSYLQSGYIDKVQINNTKSTLDSIKAQIVDACKDKTDYDKVKIVHDYLVDTIEYEQNDDNNTYNIYGALVNKKAVCEGYSRAFKYILDDLGIATVLVYGEAINTNGERESHTWNYVYLKDNWYAVDVTWDDPILRKGTMTDEIKYSYFLKGSDEFFVDHVESYQIAEGTNFKYPELCKTNY